MKNFIKLTTGYMITLIGLRPISKNKTGLSFKKRFLQRTKSSQVRNQEQANYWTQITKIQTALIRKILLWKMRTTKWKSWLKTISKTNKLIGRNSKNGSKKLNLRSIKNSNCKLSLKLMKTKIMITLLRRAISLQDSLF